MNEKVVNQILLSLSILSIGTTTSSAKNINDIKTSNRPSLNFQFLFYQFRCGKFSTLHIPFAKTGAVDIIMSKLLFFHK